MQYRSNVSALAMELLWSWTKPSNYQLNLNFVQFWWGRLAYIVQDEWSILIKDNL